MNYLLKKIVEIIVLIILIALFVLAFLDYNRGNWVDYIVSANAILVSLNLLWLISTLDK